MFVEIVLFLGGFAFFLIFVMIIKPNDLNSFDNDELFSNLKFNFEFFKLKIQFETTSNTKKKTKKLPGTAIPDNHDIQN